MTPDERARVMADRLTSWVPDEDVAMIAAAIREAVAEKEEEIVKRLRSGPVTMTREDRSSDAET